eukprot:comp30130_c0_seq1/m.47233 comp30130_c0_seq1/g.47233  ORF comp30130_c0_seq1/g.47233 comp30130_c0_seq1/m.47233 type:complete len:124 (-) comp30130_c0_seq1:51-422(-)
MKLLTHNMLQCHVKSCDKNNFPLRLEVTTVETQEAEFKPIFLKHVLSKLDWPALLVAAKQVGIENLPSEPPAPEDLSDDFLQLLHTAILETQVVEGQMVCNNCGHVYRIAQGIPNMLLAEDEV